MAGATLAARVVPIPATRGLGRMLVERNLRVARSGWLVVLSGFFEPLFYLLSIGVGLGALVGGIAVGGHLVDYRTFVAPAMLATAAMNAALAETTFNVFHKLKYSKVYRSILATPVGAADIARGEIAWALSRGGIYSAIFLLVMAALGLINSWWALLALPAALLLGAAFAAAGMALTTFLRSWQDFEYVTLVELPLFLFSATFYPLSTYPGVLQALVRVSPLYQGVALLRGLTAGDVGWAALGHVGYLLVLGLAGLAVATRRLERLLLR
ncbi:MAG TPA: ABC transporter permease [Mycobacteriales bacterium]|jgi:lipooligosaccharide transport system permease protein|nr:ABC transporter permease [Mycobacteriales bacterium]